MKTLSARKLRGFTLVEMLVSMAVLAIIMVILAQATAALQASMTQATSGVHEFEAARDAFEVMTRRIGQATLNTYNDRATGTLLTVPGYTRASELRFISGPASLASSSLAATSSPLFTTNNPYHPGHAIFFQAPLGISSSSSYASLVQALNTVGYFVEWNSDSALLPNFLPASYPAKWRYRLMEMIEPSDNLTIYTDTSGGTSSSNSWGYFKKDWFQTPYANSPNNGNPDYQCVRPIADNIICLAFLPMVAPQNAQYPAGGAPDGTSTDLMASPSGSASYLYDTSPVQTAGIPPISQNQLPPMVYALMIAVDEKSFATYQAIRGSAASVNVPTNLGVDPATSAVPFLTISTYNQRQADILNVTKQLNTNHIRYRIFSTIVPLTTH